MDILLGGLAFAAMIFAQFMAVVAVHHERKSRELKLRLRRVSIIAQGRSGSPEVEDALPRSVF